MYKDVADLPAYRERGLSYADLCVPQWLTREPPIFFGFWGSCYNSYFDAELHGGYATLTRWRDGIIGRRLLGPINADKRRAGSAKRPPKPPRRNRWWASAHSRRRRRRSPLLTACSARASSSGSGSSASCSR